MKKFTLTLVAFIMAAMSYAQPTPVVLPETATVEDYTLTGKNYFNPEDENGYEDLNETIKIGFDGNDVYIQGLCGYLPEAWIKGVRNGSDVTFESGQFYGYFTYGTASLPMYFCGYNGAITDVVFQYNEEYGIFVTDSYIVTNSNTATLDAYHYLTDVILFKGAAEPQDEVVTPPAGMENVPYIFTATRIILDEEGYHSENVTRNVTVGFAQNSEVYIQGLCEQLPEAWIVGTKNGDEATFKGGQFYGNYTDEDGEWKLYFGSRLAGQTEQIDDMTFDYDLSTGAFTSTQYMILNSTRSTYAPFEEYVNVRIERNPSGPTAIEGAETENNIVNVTYTDISGRSISNPETTRGIIIMTTTKVNGTVESKKIIK